jgi:hypothetical protein
MKQSKQQSNLSVAARALGKKGGHSLNARPR